MPIVLLSALSLHVLSAVFWAGSTFALIRTGVAGAGRLFRPQMGVAVLTGAYLSSQLLHGFGLSEAVLLMGVVCAFSAAAVQGALIGPALRAAGDEAAIVPRALIGHRFASALLAVTLVCMVAARNV